MSRRLLIVLTIALSSSAAPCLAQTTRTDAPLAARTDDTGMRVLQGNDAPRMDVRVYEGRADADGPPAKPPEKDETVGLGSAVDRAPRDIREPFDE